MNVGKINLATQNYSNSVGFGKRKSDEPEYENPVSRSTERNLAVLKSVGGAGLVGAIVGGLTTCFVNKDAAEKSLLKQHKVAIIAAAAAAAIYTFITLPASLYNTKVSAYVKQKEMDVFTRDRSLKTNLTEEVDKEVMDTEVSLDKKLDDNLKLQMANRGGAIGIANLTTQSQG